LEILPWLQVRFASAELWLFEWAVFTGQVDESIAGQVMIAVEWSSNAGRTNARSAYQQASGPKVRIAMELVARLP
jgi:hypothetical protein